MTEQEFIQNLSKISTFYAIFCNYTKMPYVECDNDTFKDKMFLFVDEEKAKAFAESYKEKKQSLAVALVNQQLAKSFFSSLIADGIDTICFMDEESSDIPMEKIITRSLKEGMKKPIENPSLQLSIMYFLQNARNTESEEDRNNVRKLEEEMMINIARATYLVPFNKMENDDKNTNSKFALLQIKNQKDQVFIPLFTDMDEFFKMNPGQENTCQFIPMGFKQIRDMKIDGKLDGFIINPGSVNLPLTPQNISIINQVFGNQID